MFPMTLTIHNHDQLAAVLAAMGTPAAAPAPKADGKVVKSTKSSAVSAEEKATVLSAEQQAAVDDTAGLEETNKGNAKAAPAVSSQPTAEAAKGDAPVKKAVAYADLQAAVLALHKLDATAAKPIAEAMGFPNFKAMPDDKWAEALEKVKAKTEEVKGGV